MTVGTPCVEGEHGAKHAETYKSEWEQEVLPTLVYIAVAGDFKYVPCQIAIAA